MKKVNKIFLKEIIDSGVALTSGGEDFIILEDDYDIGYVKVPPQNIISNPKEIVDKSGNAYMITIQPKPVEIVYKITPKEIKNKEGYKFFKENLTFMIDDSKLKFDPYEFLSPHEIITGHKRRLEWSESLVNNGMYEISVIMNVSSLETLVRDVFKNSDNSLYFSHVDDNMLDKEILKFLKSYGLISEYSSKLLHIDKNRFCVKVINSFRKISYLQLDKKYLDYLFSKSMYTREDKINAFVYVVKNLDKNIINFQQYKGQKNYFKLLKSLFDIDLQTFIQTEKVNSKCLREFLDDIYPLRHKLIHGIEKSIFINEQIAKDYFEVTKKITNFIFDKFHQMHGR